MPCFLISGQVLPYRTYSFMLYPSMLVSKSRSTNSISTIPTHLEQQIPRFFINTRDVRGAKKIAPHRTATFTPLHRTAPHRNYSKISHTAPHRTAALQKFRTPHRTAPQKFLKIAHCTAPHRTAPHHTAPHRNALHYILQKCYSEQDYIKSNVNDF